MFGESQLLQISAAPQNLRECRRIVSQGVYNPWVSAGLDKKRNCFEIVPEDGKVQRCSLIIDRKER
jgi:hypothetical protein